MEWLSWHCALFPPEACLLHAPHIPHMQLAQVCLEDAGTSIVCDKCEQMALPVSMQLYEGTLEFLPALAGQGAGSALAIVDVPKRPSKQGTSACDKMTFGQRYEQVR